MLLKLALTLTILLACSAPAFADDPQQVGLVIQFGEGEVDTLCIAVGGEPIQGDELLARSGLELIIDPSSGMGITVCKIEELGCDYPTERCFCQCMGGGPCAYWNYFYRDPGGDTWTYSPLGALLRKVSPGAVEAWVWGDGRTPPSADLSFEAICAPPTPTPSATPLPPTATAQPDQPPPARTAPSLTPPEPAASQPPPSATPTAAPETVEAPASSGYWPFGLLVLGLIAIGAVALRRRA